MKTDKEILLYVINNGPSHLRWIIDYYNRIGKPELAESYKELLDKLEAGMEELYLEAALLRLREFAEQEDRPWLDCKPSDVRLLLNAYDKVKDED